MTKPRGPLRKCSRCSYSVPLAELAVLRFSAKARVQLCPHCCEFYTAQAELRGSTLITLVRERYDRRFEGYGGRH
jgi:hypothetical protein